MCTLTGSSLHLLRLPSGSTMALASPAFLKRVDKAAKEVDDDSMDEQQSLMEGEARQKVGKGDSGKGPSGGRVLPASLRSDAGSSQPSGAGGVTARQLKAKHFLRGRPKPQPEDQEWEPLADLLLEVKQQAREAQGILETTALIPAELLCVQEALDAAREYSRRAALHKGQNLGHALVEIGLAFFQHIPETRGWKWNCSRAQGLRTRGGYESSGVFDCFWL